MDIDNPKVMEQKVLEVLSKAENIGLGTIESTILCRDGNYRRDRADLIWNILLRLEREGRARRTNQLWSLVRPERSARPIETAVSRKAGKREKAFFGHSRA